MNPAPCLRPRALRLPVAAASLAATFFFSPTVRAENPPEPSNPPPAQTPPASEQPNQNAAPAEQPPAGTSKEDLEALQKALGQDVTAEKQAAPQPQPAPQSAIGRAFQSFNPDLSFIGDFAAAAFSDSGPILQTGDHDPTHNGFNFQQLELGVAAAVDPYLEFKSYIVFHPDGVEVEEAYATTLTAPARLQFRAGQFLTRFGRINATHPHTWAFVDQPLVIGRFFGGEGNRGVGVEGSWLAPLPWYLELVLSETDASGEGTARSFLADSGVPVRSPLDLQTTAAVKQFFPFGDDWSLLFGLSYANGPNPAQLRTQIFGTDLYLKYRPLESQDFTTVALQVEGMYRLHSEIPVVRVASATAPELENLNDWGGFAQLIYRFSQRWETAARYEYMSNTRDSEGVDVAEKLNPSLLGKQQRAAVALSFFPTEFTRLRLEGQTTHITSEFVTQTQYMAFLQLEVAVGAHPAHAF